MPSRVEAQGPDCSPSGEESGLLPRATALDSASLAEQAANLKPQRCVPQSDRWTLTRVCRIRQTRVRAATQYASASDVGARGRNDPVACEMLGEALALALLQPSAAIIAKHDDMLRTLGSRPRLYAEHSVGSHIIRADAREAVSGMALAEDIHRFQQVFQMIGSRRTRTSELLRFFRPIELNSLAVDTRHSLVVKFSPHTEPRIDPPNELRTRRNAFEIVGIVAAPHER